MQRRQLLAAAGVGAASLLAGCSDDGDGDEGPETPDGEWELRGLVGNEDDEPREWRVESRSEGARVAAAWGTVPAGEERDFALLGQLRDEQLEVDAESDGGSTTASWRPAECRVLSVEVTISGGEPQLQLACRDEATPA